ncbi:MAG TPA: alpha/beta family hydrolase [Gemmatimonadaceae bacterium]|jgi:predicted alpha/beta-hydrolase family hydrolase|nr:alpha/beta family hydrolase [Gemmatimonadaceae bacterium]
METLLVRPPNAHRMLTLAHGAGAGMRHPFMEKLAALLATVGVATLRYEFPYMEQRKSRQDAAPVLHERVAAAAEVARQAAPELPLLAGGKSFGGRMTSQAAAEGVLRDVKGIVFFGFPLHPPGRPGTARADHLAKVAVPMLFLQGTRDEFAPLDLLRPIGESLGSRATLHVIDGADHGFHVLKRSGRTDNEVMGELAQAVASWDL